MSILKEIKAETEQLHKELEEIALSSRILNLTLNREEYAKLILGNYFLTSNIELNFSRFPALEESFELELRKKTSYLHKDLENLSIKIDSIKKPSIQFTPENSAQFLGMLYVQEGSSLGGAVISRHLKLNPNLSEIPSFHFYGCYGGKTGEMWKKFCTVFESLFSAGNYDREEVLKGAINTFELAKVFFK